MYKIKILKKQKNEKVPNPPRFKNKYEELLWYRKQKMKAQLLQIKHVSIQYKDIQKMLFERVFWNTKNQRNNELEMQFTICNTQLYLIT